VNYLLALYAGSEIFELEVPRGGTASVGSSESDVLRLDRVGIEPQHLKFGATETGVHVFSKTPIWVRGEVATNRMLSVGDIARLDEKLSVAVFEKRCDMEGLVSLTGWREVTIGRSRGSDICLSGPQVSLNHAVLRTQDGAWVLEDLGSSNGTFVNGMCVTSTRLADNAVIFLGGWKFLFFGDSLCFRNTAGGVSLSPKLSLLGADLSDKSFRGARYPFFQRSPRLKPKAETLDVEILSPPNTGSKPSVSWFSVLLPPVMMILVMLFVSSVMKNRSMLYYTVPMSCVSILVSIVNYRSQMKKWREIQRKAREKYEEHLREKDAEITAAETKFIQALDTVNPSVHECAGIASRVDRRLWERGVPDDDFLESRIGTGRTASNVRIKIPQAQLSIEEDPLLKEAKALKDRHASLSGVPVAHSFMRSTVTGLAGSRASVQKMAWAVLMGVATHHSYEDVKIACVYPETERREWEWVRWLPHAWNENRTERTVACDPEGGRQMLRELGDMLKSRRRSVSEERGGMQAPQMPFYFILLADKSIADESGAQLLPESSSLGMSVVCAYGEMGLLPGGCQAIINCGEPVCSLHLKSGASDGAVFVPDRVSLSLADSFARSLAPVRFRASSANASMPDYVAFLQGYGVNRVEDLDVLGRWSASHPYRSIAAPIGVRENGETFYFDIHEKGMGPHGIVAGATRWGKSETLTTWLLSVALNFHPHEVSFVLIDFKGDGLSGILMDLPHVAGVISNVDDMSSIERNLRSLHGELLRRQRVFKDTKLENIHKYQEAYRNGRAPEPMPYLIIVIDEFAELKTQFPDQMNEFISIARVGGSLGVYMVLATQSPGGIVAGQVSANSRFRICLKTSESGESKEILGTADAFRITVRGRAYIKVGNNEVYEQIQTFYSKAPYQPSSGPSGPADRISVVGTDGRRSLPEVYEKTIGSESGDLGEGRAVSQFIKETARKNNISNARQVWAEALPRSVFLSSFLAGREAFRNGEWKACNDGLSVVAGLVDDPEGQVRYPLTLDFAGEGHHILYGAPSSGKTVFLQTALMSAAALYTPEQVQFLVLDFGSWGMKIFEHMPHTILVADANDEERVKRADEYLRAELSSRKLRFSEQGVGTLGAYREVTGEAVPAVIIAVDNMASLYNMYPDLLDSLTDLAREGGGLGLYLLMTSGSQGSFMYRVSQYVKASYALQLADRADYRALVGGSGKQEPAHLPGRGFAKGPLEFQTALCAEGANEGERVKQMRSICAAMTSAWKGPTAAASTVPKEIDPDSLSFGRDYVQMGFDKQESSPFEFAFGEMNGCVISGLPGSGKTNVMGWIVRALASDPDTDVYVYDKGGALGALGEALKVAHDGGEFDAFLTAVAEEYDRRSDEGGNSPRIALCIDNFVKFYEEVSDEGAALLDVLVRCGDEYGIYVYVTGNVTELTRFHNLSVKPLKSCLANGGAIALGGRLKNHALFDDLHRSEDIALKDHEGCVIRGGEVRVVRFARALTVVTADA
jgi:S-DNA-T family DNA segregation ATPase FtsK/SpoIIIE